jgi:hypothetical protein
LPIGTNTPAYCTSISINVIKRLRECIKGKLLANMSAISLSIFQLMTLSSKSTIFEQGWSNILLDIKFRLLSNINLLQKLPTGTNTPAYCPSISINVIKRLRECIKGRLLANMSAISLSVFQLMTLSSKSTIFE